MATSADTLEIEHLRGRVGLYLGVMLVIDLLAHVSELVGPLVSEELVKPEMPLSFVILWWTVPVVLVAGWSVARFTRPGRRTLVALESGVTVVLVLVEVPLGFAYPWEAPVQAPAFVLLGMTLLLVVRAALVPSTVGRTVLLGIATVTWVVVVGDRSLGGLQPVMIDALTFMGGAFVVATGVTSHVIYGLRRQVREARRLGQYELGRKLGEGGMGVVYEATHVMLRRPTAVKLLPVERAGEQTIARFEREVRQTSRLEHPNTVSIYDYGRTPDGLFYYAMEYLDGLTLEQLVELDGMVPAARAALILRQAARALDEAHAMGLVHRDIKPANIMLCERARVPDTVKVLDFGLVKALDNPEADGLTQANTIVGTPHYLAPEAISSSDDVGPPSDVYALGAVGFFLLTGRPVFTGASVIEVCSKHLTAAPESPSEVRGAPIDADLEALVLQCLAKVPEDRPGDGGVLAEALEGLELPGWGSDHARVWWRDLPARRAGAGDLGPGEPTRLTVDVEGRR